MALHSNTSPRQAHQQAVKANWLEMRRVLHRRVPPAPLLPLALPLLPLQPPHTSAAQALHPDSWLQQLHGMHAHDTLLLTSTSACTGCLPAA